MDDCYDHDPMTNVDARKDGMDEIHCDRKTMTLLLVLYVIKKTMIHDDQMPMDVLMMDEHYGIGEVVEQDDYFETTLMMEWIVRS